MALFLHPESGMQRGGVTFPSDAGLSPQIWVREGLIWDPQTLRLGLLSDQEGEGLGWLVSLLPCENGSINFNELKSYSDPRIQELALEIENWVKEGEKPSTMPVHQTPQIRSLTIQVSQLCNLSCAYCAAGGDGTYKNPGRLEAGRFWQSLEGIFASQPLHEHLRISFSGGEPLLFPKDLRMVAEGIKLLASKYGRRISFSLVTNGTRFSSETLKILSDFKMDVSVSIDGPPQVQDLYRSIKGAFVFNWDEALELLFSYRDSLGSVTASAVFHSDHVDCEETYFYLSRWPFDGYDFNWNYFDDNREALERYLNSFALLLERIWEIDGEKGIKKFVEIRRIFQLLEEGFSKAHFCGAGVTHLSVSRQGKVFPCPWVTDQQSFQILTLDDRKPFRPKSLEHLPPCYSCWARPLCGGGCTFMQLQGDPENFCKMMKFLISQVFRFYKRREFYEKADNQNVDKNGEASVFEV